MNNSQTKKKLRNAPNSFKIVKETGGGGVCACVWGGVGVLKRQKNRADLQAVLYAANGCTQLRMSANPKSPQKD